MDASPSPSDENVLRGRFWLATNPERQREGQLDLHAGVLETQGELVECTVVTSASPNTYKRAPLNDAGVEYCLYGVTDDGVELTVPAVLRGACNDKVEPSPQQFLFLQTHVEAHTRPDDTYRSINMAWNVELGSWDGALTHAPTGPVLVSTEAGIMSIREIPDLDRQTIQRGLIEPMTSLLTAVSGQSALPTGVMLEMSSRVAIQVRRKQPSAAARRSEPFFDHRRLRTHHLNRWFALVKDTNPIPSIAARALQDSGSTLESRTMTLAASAEALHRELHDEPKIDKATAKELRECAAAAVPDEHRERVKTILGSLGSQSFQDRLTWLADSLGDVAEEICGSVAPPDVPGAMDEPTPRAKWVRAVAKARNSFAHQNPQTPQDLCEYVDQALTRCESMQWFVVACLLIECGVGVDEIAREFHRRSA